MTQTRRMIMQYFYRLLAWMYVGSREGARNVARETLVAPAKIKAQIECVEQDGLTASFHQSSEKAQGWFADLKAAASTEYAHLIEEGKQELKKQEWEREALEAKKAQESHSNTTQKHTDQW